MEKVKLLYNYNDVTNLLLSLLPTGSQGASPKAHLSCLVKYRLSLRVFSKASSEIGCLVVDSAARLNEIRLTRTNAKIR